MQNKTLKIGVMGAGHLGKIHMRQIRSLDVWELHGFFDPDPEQRRKAEEEFGVRGFEDPESLITQVEAVDIVAPTIAHFELASLSLRHSRAVFIEKPITQTVEQARELLNIAQEANVKMQIGHVERFNPAFIAARELGLKPMFIETHRLSEFNPRGTDVSVVLDLMIHDLDIVLSTVNSGVRKVSASGVAVVSDTPDIANARIEFDNGCVANLTASRISMKNMRKSRFFQKDAYIAVDFLNKQVERISLSAYEPGNPYALVLDTGKEKKTLHLNQPEIKDHNAIREELRCFHESITLNKPEVVSGLDGLNALQVAYQVIEQMDKRNGI